MSALAHRLNDEREIDLERYRDDGYGDRYDYLCGLAEEHGLTIDQLAPLLDVLPPSEDFDGLVVALEDHAELLGGHA